MKAVLWTLASVLAGVLLLYVPQYAHEQDAFRGELQAKVMEARLETMRKERDAEKWREHERSLAAKWSVMPTPREESERRISAILEGARNRQVRDE